MYVEGGPEAQLYVRAGGRELEFVGSYGSALGVAADLYVAPIPNVIGVRRIPVVSPHSADPVPRHRLPLPPQRRVEEGRAGLLVVGSLAWVAGWNGDRYPRRTTDNPTTAQPIVGQSPFGRYATCSPADDPGAAIA